MDEMASDYCYYCRHECTYQIQDNNTTHGFAAAFVTASQSCNYQEKYQYRRDCFQSAYKQSTQNADSCYARNSQTQDSTHNQATNNTFY